MAILGILFLMFLAASAGLLSLWWRGRLSPGVMVAIGLLQAAFVGWVLLTGAFWQQHAERSWADWGVYSGFAGSDRLGWWQRPARDLGQFVGALANSPGMLSYHAEATVDAGWEKRAAWVLFWVLVAMTLAGLKHRKVKVPILLVYIAMLGFFLWAIGRPAETQVEATLGDDDESLMLMERIGWGEMSAEELLPLAVYQAAVGSWREQTGSIAAPPLEYAECLQLLIPPAPRPLRWRLTLPRTRDGAESGQLLLELVEIQAWYLYGLALARHLEAHRPLAGKSQAVWTSYADLSGLSPELVDTIVGDREWR